MSKLYRLRTGEGFEVARRNLELCCDVDYDFAYHNVRLVLTLRAILPLRRSVALTMVNCLAQATWSGSSDVCHFEFHLPCGAGVRVLMQFEDCRDFSPGCHMPKPSASDLVPKSNHGLCTRQARKLHAGKLHVLFERRTEASVIVRLRASSDPTEGCRQSFRTLPKPPANPRVGL